MQSKMLSRPSFMTLLHSSMCSDTGTEYGMGGSVWLLGLSDSSVHEVTTVVVGSSLTGMGVARGAGMHCALDRSAKSGDKGKRLTGTLGAGLGSCGRVIPGPMSPRDSSPLEDI